MQQRGSSSRAAATALALLSLSSACAADPRIAAAKAAATASLPASVAAGFAARLDKEPARFLELSGAVEKEAGSAPDLLRRVDKKEALPQSYSPGDLVSLDKTGISVSRAGHRLREPAFEALKAMDKAARSDGITLIVGSAFRSYDYQVEVFARNAREAGSEAAAERISARPGKSQHQLGMAIDFSPIDDAFATTAASRWLERNAGRFGFSLSFPRGLEAVTGYSWESWHYRYIGKSALSLQKEFFGDVQQYLVEFWEAYTAK
jgi:D-alanyl-D-alanine carboxypeptidase